MIAVLWRTFNVLLSLCSSRHKLSSLLRARIALLCSPCKWTLSFTIWDCFFWRVFSRFCMLRLSSNLIKWQTTRKKKDFKHFGFHIKNGAFHMKWSHVSEMDLHWNAAQNCIASYYKTLLSSNLTQCSFGSLKCFYCRKAQFLYKINYIINIIISRHVAYQICIFLAQGSQLFLWGGQGVESLHQQDNFLPCRKPHSNEKLAVTFVVQRLQGFEKMKIPVFLCFRFQQIS